MKGTLKWNVGSKARERKEEHWRMGNEETTPLGLPMAQTILVLPISFGK